MLCIVTLFRKCSQRFIDLIELITSKIRSDTFLTEWYVCKLCYILKKIKTLFHSNDMHQNTSENRSNDEQNH